MALPVVILVELLELLEEESVKLQMSFSIHPNLPLTSLASCLKTIPKELFNKFQESISWLELEDHGVFGNFSNCNKWVNSNN